MAIREPGSTQAISDTGPLISIFQSNSLDVVTTLLPVIHIPQACADELAKHGWKEALQLSNSRIQIHALSDKEKEAAWSIAQRIAAHAMSGDPEPAHHLGEAQAIVLATRPEYASDVLLIDELAARAVAQDIGLALSGFPGVLLVAAQEGLLSAEEVKERLETCRRQGTHYSKALIKQVYSAAKEGERG